MGRQASGQNTSSAVMQQRREARDALDDFPTPPWATRALCEHLFRGMADVAETMTCREPAANRGYMVAPLLEWFDCVMVSDVHDYGVGFPVEDYLFGPDPSPVDWTITNPPYRLAEEFVARALNSSTEGVAMLVRTAWLEGVGRYARLFSARPPDEILQFSERVVMHKGRVVEKGSSATAYAWVVWDMPVSARTPTEFNWIAPCRKRLERPGDYALRGDAVGAERQGEEETQ